MTIKIEEATNDGWFVETQANGVFVFKNEYDLLLFLADKLHLVELKTLLNKVHPLEMCAKAE